MWTRRRTPAAFIALDDGAGALGVDESEVGATAEVTRDRDEMHDAIDAGERRRHRGRHGHIGRSQLHTRALGRGQAREHDLATRRGASERDDAVSGIDERRHGVRTDEAAGAGDEDGRHGMVPCVLRVATCGDRPTPRSVRSAVQMRRDLGAAES